MAMRRSCNPDSSVQVTIAAPKFEMAYMLTDKEYVRALNVVIVKGLECGYSQQYFVYGKVKDSDVENILQQYKHNNPEAYVEVFDRKAADFWIQYAVFDNGWFDIGKLAPNLTIQEHRSQNSQ